MFSFNIVISVRVSTRLFHLSKDSSVRFFCFSSLLIDAKCYFCVEWQRYFSQNELRSISIHTHTHIYCSAHLEISLLLAHKTSAASRWEAVIYLRFSFSRRAYGRPLPWRSLHYPIWYVLMYISDGERKKAGKRRELFWYIWIYSRSDCGCRSFCGQSRQRRHTQFYHPTRSRKK